MTGSRTWSHGERLYQLLPAIHRNRDAAQGEVLRALLSVIEGELEALERNIEDLYENWFIETGDEWVIPYIGDLLGVRPLHPVESAGTFSLRAYVANTLAYRRRKGTAAVLEQLARDVTGWPARTVEFFQLLATTQHLNHVRLHNVRTPDLRGTDALELLDTPFETAPRTGEVRRIASRRGRYNIPSLGIFLWRLQAYAVTRGRARAVGTPAQGRYTFHPLGLDAPLFNRPRTETTITHLAEEVNVPGMLRRRALHDDLAALRRALAEGRTPRSRYFGSPPVLQLFLDEQFDDQGRPVPLPPEEILVCDLSDWRRPPASVTLTRRRLRPDGSTAVEEVELPIRAGVDPVLGRIAFPPSREPARLHVSYAWGFSGDVGGGPYDRQESLSALLTRPVTWQVGVTRDPRVGPMAGERIFRDLTEAVRAWNAQPPGTVGIIAVMDSDTYRENLTGAAAIQIPQGSQLLILAGEWPPAAVPGSPDRQERRPGRVILDGLRPHIRGTLSVRGITPGGAPGAGELVLNGLLVEGELRVLVGNLGSLRLVHSTLAPGFGGLRVNASAAPGSQNDRLQVSVQRSILGGITLAPGVPGLHLEESVVDRPGRVAVDGPGSRVKADRCTVLGRTVARRLEAGESIFMETVTVERRQEGCVRSSYVPAGSRTPRRYRCQPDLALKGVDDPEEAARIRARLRPAFTSDDYGHPAYVQLGATCPEEIRTGAEDGAEMGVFNHLKQPQRMSNLAAVLEEYLPFGLESGVFFVT